MAPHCPGLTGTGVSRGRGRSARRASAPARDGSSGRDGPRSRRPAGRAPCRPARRSRRSGPTAATIPLAHCAASLIGTISPVAVSVSSSGSMTMKSSSGSSVTSLMRESGSSTNHVSALDGPAATMRWRNCCVRGSCGAEKICSGGPCSSIDALVEEADAVGDLAREAHLVRRDQHRHARRPRARGSPRAPRRRAPGRARSSPRRAASARAPSRARGRSRRAAAGRPRAGRDTRRACRRGRSARAARRARASASARGAPSTARGASVTFRSTVMCGNRLNAWNTIPIRRRTRFDVDAAAA